MIQTNVCALKTYLCGMVNIVSHAQLELNLTKKKDNAITAQKDLSEIITATHVLQDFEKMIYLSVYLLYC